MRLDRRQWGAVRNDHHRNCRGGLRFTGAFGHGMQRAWRLKEALSRVYLLDRLAFDRESRATSCDIHVDGAWVAVGYGGLLALGFELEPDDHQLLSQDILERRRARKSTFEGLWDALRWRRGRGLPATQNSKESDCP